MSKVLLFTNIIIEVVQLDSVILEKFDKLIAALSDGSCGRGAEASFCGKISGKMPEDGFSF